MISFIVFRFLKPFLDPVLDKYSLYFLLCDFLSYLTDPLLPCSVDQISHINVISDTGTHLNFPEQYRDAFVLLVFF